MGDVVIALLNHPDQTETVLNAGTRLLNILGGGRLTALAVRMPPVEAILPSEEVLTASREVAIRAEQQAWAGTLRPIVETWAERTRSSGNQTEWIDIEGNAAQVVTDYGRRADAIVVSRPVHHEHDRMRDAGHAALFDTETPVLIVPPGYAGPLGDTVAIAWKDDVRAVKAVRASMRILREARHVHVLCAGPKVDIPAVLHEHGIAAELHAVPADDGNTGERLLHAAHEVGADMLIMGAFAHAEWRELIFGGVTRHMLTASDLPLLMRH